MKAVDVKAGADSIWCRFPYKYSLKLVGNCLWGETHLYANWLEIRYNLILMFDCKYNNFELYRCLFSFVKRYLCIICEAIHAMGIDLIKY